LGKFATVFQTNIYAILQCACENIRRAYKRKRIFIFSDSQATLKALSNPKVTSSLVAECLYALAALASLNEVTLVWVPGHCGIPGNEEADRLARQASAMPLLGPGPLLEYLGVQQEEQLRTGLSINIIAPGKIYQVRDMTSFTGRPCKKRAEDLLK
jgi:ribonuclease HI